MKTEKLIKLAEIIEKDNEAFKALTKPQKRVVIAQDCLARIDIGQINPYRGSMIKSTTIEIIDRYSGSLQEVLNNPNELVCDVCAKGGLFLSLVGRVNEYECKNVIGGNKFWNSEHRKLLTIFTPRQLAYIEYAFEGTQHLNFYQGKNIEFSAREDRKVREFNNTYDSSNQLMVAICENIIKNKGLFKL